jgi:hypothetical protein
MREDSREAEARFRRRERSLAARRFGLRAAALRAGPAPRRPVFLVGCPRSGTTLLFDLLRRHPGFASRAAEGHLIWDTYQHPARNGWDSDRRTGEDVWPGETRFVHASVRRVAGSRPFLDKTPKNALRVPYLSALFPDARFVFLVRDGRATVASLIEGWSEGHGITYRLPEPLSLTDYRGRYWSYLLPPGWREVAATSFEDVAARQFVAANDAARADLDALPQERVVRVRFESLLEAPVDVTANVLDRLGMPPSGEVADAAAELRAVSTVSPPRPGKWRDRADRVERVMPSVAPTMRRLGYEVSP